MNEANLSWVQEVRLMGTPAMYTISKSRFIAASYCQRRLWLETHKRDEGEGATGSAVEWGNAVGELARQLRPEGRLIGHSEGFGEALEETRLALAADGDITLFEPAFSAAGMAVRCDILERRDGRYTLAEVKASASSKLHHPADLAYQVAALEAAGIRVERAYLQLIDRDFVYQGDGDYRRLFRREDFSDPVRELGPGIPALLKEYQEVLAGPEPARERGSHCGKPWPCGFQARCAIGEAEFPISLLGLSNKAFVEAALAGNWRDVCDIPESYEMTPRARRIWEATTSGAAILTSEARSAFGAARPKLQYLDFETWSSPIPRWRGTRPYQQLPFQWSMHTDHGAGELDHCEFLDESGEFPVRRATEALIDAAREECPIAVYTGFEHRTINTMIEFCPDLEVALRKIQARLLDLHPLAKTSYYHRDMRGNWSIKAVLPTIAPELDYGNLGEIQEGDAATAAYAEIIAPETSPERRAQLIGDLKRYCKRDTEAMVALVRHLAGKEIVVE